MSRADLQVRVKQLGGEVSQNPTRTTFCVATFTTEDLRTKNFVATGKYLVVKGDWLCRSVAAGRLLPLTPLDCVFADAEVRAGFAGKYDRFGDSFDEDVDEARLREIVNNIDDVDSADVSDEDVRALKDELFTDSPLAIFYGKTVYLDMFERIGDPSTKMKNSSLEIAAVDIVGHSGKVVDHLEEAVTHVVCDDPERAEGYRRLRRERTVKFHLVNSIWVEDSMRKGHILEERFYEPY